MTIDPDAFTLGGLPMVALSHDNTGDPVCPTDRCQGFKGTKLFDQCVTSSAGAPIATASSSLRLLCPCCLHMIPVSCYPSVFLSKHKMTTHYPFFLNQHLRFPLPSLLFALPLGHVCYNSQSVNKNPDHFCSQSTVQRSALRLLQRTPSRKRWTRRIEGRKG